MVWEEGGRYQTRLTSFAFEIHLMVARKNTFVMSTCYENLKRIMPLYKDNLRCARYLVLKFVFLLSIICFSWKNNWLYKQEHDPVKAKFGRKMHTVYSDTSQVDFHTKAS